MNAAPLPDPRQTDPPGAPEPDPASVTKPEQPEAPAEAERQPSIPEQLSRLYADGRALFEVELDFQRTRAEFVGAQAKRSAILIVAALVVFIAALIGLVFGSLLGLSIWFGPWTATLIVFVGSCIGAYLLFKLGMWHIRKAAAAFAKPLGAQPPAESEAGEA